MEKLKKFDWAMIALLLMGARSVYDANIAQALIVACFCGFIGYMRFLDTKKQPDINAELQEELARIKSTVSALGVKNAAKPDTKDVRFF